MKTMEKGLTQKSDEALQKELEDCMAEKGFSQAQVSRSLGRPASALCQWLKNCFEGNISKFEEEVKAFLRREKEKAKWATVEIGFIKTSVADHLFETAEMCHLDCSMGVAIGDPGLGKTRAVEEYTRLNPSVILIETNPGWSVRTIVRKIHLQVGLDGRGSTDDMVDEIVSRLQGSGRLIIIDEAENLDSEIINLLRRIYDHAHVGILFVGMPRLLHNIKGSKGELGQLKSRSSVSCELDLITKDDVKDIVETCVPHYEELVETFFTESEGNTRILSMLIVRSLRMAYVNKEEKVTPEIIREAKRLITV